VPGASTGEETVLDVHYTIRQLQYFVAVAQSGTVSTAAARCHVSQSALSLAISQLERSLGVKLFVRQRAKGAELTLSGQRLLERAESLLQQAGELQVQIEIERGAELRGTLPLGCYTGLAPLYIPSLLAHFKEECPGVALEFTEDAQPALLRGLREGIFELALLYDTDLSSDIEYTVVDELRPYVLLPENHPLAGSAEVSLLDLADEPMIEVDLPPSRENWTKNMAEIGIEPNVAYRSRSFELVRCLVGRGLGYTAMFQRPLIDRTYEGHAVVARPIVEEITPARVVLGYPAGSTPTTRARSFMTFAVKTFMNVRDRGDLVVDSAN
jgi:DNA-binding transcriptional LysR family regulator